MVEEEEIALKKIILNQDIDFYHEYMEDIQKKIGDEYQDNKDDLVKIHHAVESIWVALINLREIIKSTS